MISRRYVRRGGFRRMRKRAKYQWVREVATNVVASSPIQFDLLSNFKSRFGIIFNLPDIVIWRVHIKVSIGLTISSFTPATAVLFALYCENQFNVVNSFTDPYAEKFLMFDNLYAADQVLQAGSISIPTLYKEYDIRTHRKLANMEETLFAQFTQQGNATMTAVDYTTSILLKLP